MHHNSFVVVSLLPLAAGNHGRTRPVPQVCMGGTVSSCPRGSTHALHFSHIRLCTCFAPTRLDLDLRGRACLLRQRLFPYFSENLFNEGKGERGCNQDKVFVPPPAPAPDILPSLTNILDAARPPARHFFLSPLQSTLAPRGVCPPLPPAATHAVTTKSFGRVNEA